MAASVGPSVAWDRSARSLEHATVRLYDVKTRIPGAPWPAKWLDECAYILPVDATGKANKDNADVGFKDIKTWISKGDYDEVFLMCHGWNNTPRSARRFYRDVFSALAAQRADKPEAREGNSGVPKKALYLALYWPSIVNAETWDKFWARPLYSNDFSLVLTFDDTEPEAPKLDRGAVIPELAKLMPESTRDQFLSLCNTDTGGGPNSELAKLLHTFLNTASNGSLDMGEGTAAVSHTNVINANSLVTTLLKDIDLNGTEARDMLASWGNTAASTAPSAQAADAGVDDESLSLIQYSSVRFMKDRAAGIGEKGAADLLIELVKNKQPVHLIGHSFGCKVLLEAVLLASCKENWSPVHSMVLVQPAVSRWAFSKKVTQPWWRAWKNPQPGRYANIPQAKNVVRPVVVLYSNYDSALFKAYPLAFSTSTYEEGKRRAMDEDPDLGYTVKIADSYGSTFAAAALGAHGPDLDGCEGALRCGMGPGGKVTLTVVENTCVIGIKGTWEHTWTFVDADSTNGWCRPSVARILYDVTSSGTWP